MKEAVVVVLMAAAVVAVFLGIWAAAKLLGALMAVVRSVVDRWNRISRERRP